MILSQEYTPVVFLRRASVATIMYHGTNGDLLPIILSQGLIPNPKKRVWKDDENSGFNVPSRASLPGIYLTTNLMTALSSGSKVNQESQILVVVMVQSGSLIGDEDEVKYRLNGALPGHEYTIRNLYCGWQVIKNRLDLSDQQRSEIQEYLDKTMIKFITECVNGINYKIKGGLTTQEREQLIPVLRDGFYITLARKASYVDKYTWGYSSDNFGVPIPDKAAAEAVFKQLEDRLTRLLKRLGRPEHLKESWNPTARIETPITYSGKNKIITVVEILPYVMGKGTPVKVIYPPSGEVPKKLIEDWSKAQGDWQNAVDLGKQI